jgi:hypothetical protein
MASPQLREVSRLYRDCGYILYSLFQQSKNTSMRIKPCFIQYLERSETAQEFPSLDAHLLYVAASVATFSLQKIDFKKLQNGRYEEYALW